MIKNLNSIKGLAPSRRPLHVHVATLIKQRIKQGQYIVGSQLPSVRQFSQEIGVSHNAVQRALGLLHGEGVVQPKHGVGIVVTDSAKCSETALFFGFVQPYYNHFSRQLQSALDHSLNRRTNFCVMQTSHDDPQRERQVIEHLIANGMNGLLVWPVDGYANAAFYQDVARRIPMVLVDRIIPNLKISSVVIDCYSAGEEIAQHLYDLGRRRVLVVCDPVEISTFLELKQGLKRRAQQLGPAFHLEICDYPVIQMLVRYEERDYQLADACYNLLEPKLRTGDYDTLFCSQDDFFEYVFIDPDRTDILRGLQLASTYGVGRLTRSRKYYASGIVEWGFDLPGMIQTALDILQEMVLTRRRTRRTVRLSVFLGSGA